MYSIKQGNVKSELKKKREKYRPQSFITPFTILPLGTLPDVTVTSVLSFRHTTIHCNTSLFTTTYVVRYVMTLTAAGTSILCRQQ